MIRMIAPEGYKYKDKRNNNEYSEVVTDDRGRKNYVLVPDNSEEMVEV